MTVMDSILLQINQKKTNFNELLTRIIPNYSSTESARAALSRVIKNLVSFGYIKKTEDFFEITEKGKKIEEESKLNISSEEIGWVANDYKEGDIKGKTYTVVEGDTLWEIAEAVYGNGFEWERILSANSDSISYLPNGSQALIVPDQVLQLP